MQQIAKWLGDNWGLVAVGVGALVEITPIKINPLSWLGRLIGKFLLSDINKRLDAQGKAIDENEKDRIRWEVLDFANSCQNGRKHTKEEFEHIITLQQKYTKLLKKTNDENGVFEAAYEYVLDLYKECTRNNSFL